MDLYHNTTNSSSAASSRSLTSCILRLPIVAVQTGIQGARYLLISVSYTLRTGLKAVHLFFRPLTIDVSSPLRLPRNVLTFLSDSSKCKLAYEASDPSSARSSPSSAFL